jgi:ribosomal protein S3AE
MLNTKAYLKIANNAPRSLFVNFVKEILMDFANNLARKWHPKITIKKMIKKAKGFVYAFEKEIQSVNKAEKFSA